MLEDNQFYLGFNSTLVQLKESPAEIDAWMASLFQFYLSSIKSR